MAAKKRAKKRQRAKKQVAGGRRGGLTASSPAIAPPGKAGSSVMHGLAEPLKPRPVSPADPPTRHGPQRPVGPAPPSAVDELRAALELSELVAEDEVIREAVARFDELSGSRRVAVA